MKAKWFSTLLIVMMLAVAIVPAAGAAPATVGSGTDEVPNVGANTDSPSHPLGDRQAVLHAKGLEEKLNGKTSGPVAEVAKGQFVQLARQGEDSIWTVVAQFGNSINPTYGGTAGPVRNQIPQPDRSVDNSTIWAPDFSQSYYQNLLFSQAPGAVSMRNFYIEQSSNRYTVNGVVENWVEVPFNEANYGADYCGDIVCARTWLFVRDSVNAWYNAQVAAGKTAAQINAYLAQFDKWDRYDYDGDGNFNEPDGYIDHFQAIHAGEGEETGGGAQGADAIWSHRWYAFYNNIGVTGPAFNKYGGVQIGGSNLWIGDYTVEPENGGVGVFSHEFGHDLGLPDLYDTSGNTGGAENSTGFWTLYSSGSYGNSGIPADGIGSKPIPMSAYEKIFLGWSDYTLLNYKQKASVKLGPSNYTTKQAQQLVVLLPDKFVDFHIGDPYSGAFFYYSGSGNQLDNTMTRQVTLPAGSVSLAAKVNYDAELDFDYGFLTVNGTPIQTNLSSGTDPNGNNPSLQGITGSSNGAWVDLSADLSAFAGQTVTIGFEYKTDPAVSRSGFMFDDIAITGQALDDAETDPGWTYHGFTRSGSTVSLSFFNAYFAEFRTYKGYDDGLRTGPYNFGNLNTLPLWVEHFPYQDGLLVWYYDTSFPDNNVGDHCLSGRCGGLYLPVDAHPNIEHWPDGTVIRPRIQSYDSTFGLEATDKITVHTNGVAKTIGSQPAVPTFNDMNTWWHGSDGHNHSGQRYIPGYIGVDVPKTGTTIRVVGISSQGNFMQVEVNK